MSLTRSGHILCSKCLFSCLLAAISRHPNPHPIHHPPRPKPKTKAKRNLKKSKKREPQPVEWTAEQLAETWKHYRDIEYEEIAREAGLDEFDIQAGRDDGEVGVEMVLKGLWKVDGQVVVEGECPVSLVETASVLMRANVRYVEKDYQGDLDHQERE
jgi:hypothetical protein